MGSRVGTFDDRAARDAWVQRVLGVAPGGGAAGAGLPAALAQWRDRRADVVGTLRSLEAAIRAMKHPRGDGAIILVRAISANLTAVPESPRQVAELRRYLETDDIIDDAELENGFGIPVRIRAPLLPALAALERAMAA